MEIRNLTPHTLSLVTADGRTVTLPPTGIVPRRETIRQAAPAVSLGIPEGCGWTGWAGQGDGNCPVHWLGDCPPQVVFEVAAEALGAVVGLPAPEAGVILVVSRLVAEAVPGRMDVYAPGEAVRDDAGRIVGARGLCRVVPATLEEGVAQGTWGDGPLGGRDQEVMRLGVCYIADEARSYPPSDCFGGRVTYRMADGVRRPG